VSFSSVFHRLPIADLAKQSHLVNDEMVLSTLSKRELTTGDFPVLISEAAGTHLEELCHRSQRMTQQRFGKVIRFFAPLYLSNECINNCKYSDFRAITPSSG